MKYCLILVGILFLGCGSGDDEERLSNCIFPLNQDSQTEVSSTKVHTIEELWDISAEQDSLRCKNADLLLFDYLHIDNRCIPVTIDWPCDVPPGYDLFRRRDAVDIGINGRDEILWQGELVSIAALDTLFTLFYLNQGEIPTRPRSPNRTRFYVEWSPDANQEFVKELLLKLTNQYSKVLRTEIGEVDDVCRSYENKKQQLKSKFPFNLKLVYDEWDYDRIPPVPPAPPENIEFIDE